MRRLSDIAHFEKIVSDASRSRRGSRLRSLFSMRLRHLSARERLDLLRRPLQLLAPRLRYFMLTGLLLVLLQSNPFGEGVGRNGMRLPFLLAWAPLAVAYFGAAYRGNPGVCPVGRTLARITMRRLGGGRHRRRAASAGQTAGPLRKRPSFFWKLAGFSGDGIRLAVDHNRAMVARCLLASACGLHSLGTGRGTLGTSRPPVEGSSASRQTHLRSLSPKSQNRDIRHHVPAHRLRPCPVRFGQAIAARSHPSAAILQPPVRAASALFDNVSRAPLVASVGFDACSRDVEIARLLTPSFNSAFLRNASRYDHARQLPTSYCQQESFNSAVTGKGPRSATNRPQYPRAHSNMLKAHFQRNLPGTQLVRADARHCPFAERCAHGSCVKRDSENPALCSSRAERTHILIVLDANAAPPSLDSAKKPHRMRSSHSRRWSAFTRVGERNPSLKFRDSLPRPSAASEPNRRIPPGWHKDVAGQEFRESLPIRSRENPATKPATTSCRNHLKTAGIQV